uniref:Uncharacterized protein n=1 Tax=Arundo donax TaxID=35708 RepID=A0A0A8Y7V1_ARUDO
MCKLSGEFPSFLQKCQRLIFLDLGHNQFFGTLMRICLEGWFIVPDRSPGQPGLKSSVRPDCNDSRRTGESLAPIAQETPARRRIG